jgi:recombination protein RecA
MIEFGKGINKEAEIVDMAVEFDIIHKSGSWFSYEDAKICQGRDNLIALMNDNPEFKEEVEAKVHAHLENKPSGVLELEDVLGTEL